ncbi:MAG TPA: glycosyltransferase family 4 protein [Gaiellaceae bacterium]|jgi:glycosyltransferase involved in cell wall biosynthesis|nr:glycosyltransferase family 4 protein [Gaiellaceae bacterium]
MKLLLVTLYFPPAGGGGVQRPLKFASHLPALGIETHVLAPDDPKWVHSDSELPLPTQAWVHRARYVGPSGRRIADELHGRSGVDLALRRASTIGRRLLLPDENVTWNATAIPKALSIARSEGIDVVLTTSPPGSVHLIGAAVKRATGAKWVADLRDSIALHAHRSSEGVGALAKQKARAGIAHLVARQADAIVTAAEAITAETRGLEPRGRVVTIPNGCDFDDFAGLEHTRADRFRVVHAGSFFGKRDPRPFLRALAASGLEDVTVRFLGDFRPGDREFMVELGLADRVELVPHVPRRESLRLQRDSDVLLLLIPEAGGRGRGILSGKVFEYLAAERPVLAVVPPDGAAASLIRETGAGIVAAPEDVDGIRDALVELHARWRDGRLDDAPLSPEWREKLSRGARVEELAALLRSIA